MARFLIINAVYGQPPSQHLRVWPRGTTIADSAANAIGSDVVWPSLCGSPPPTSLAPLDAAAQALMPGSSIVGPNTPPLAIWQGGAGQDANR
jgi:hypothetical protein